MRSVIQNQHGKISLLVGERDEKFVDMAMSLKEEIPNLKVDIVPDASHRILFDCPYELAEKIKSLLKQIL
ncbi:2-succinyl-6-hydroxy-2,4-cyclohexadiene-1-carboxylate synthase [compost metagenome]